MVLVRRYDRGELEPIERTPEGFLRADAYVTAPGVYTYKQADGTIRRELRPEEEVFDAASLASLKGKDTTLQHPIDPMTGETVFVEPETYHLYSTGCSGQDVRIDNGRVRVTLYIKRVDHIEAIDNGELAEQSCGYHCEWDGTPGVHPKYGPYDGVQRKIRYNHIATVDEGRLGASIRLRADSARLVFDADSSTSTPEEPSMTTIDLPNGQKVTLTKEQVSTLFLASLTGASRNDSSQGAAPGPAPAPAPPPTPKGDESDMMNRLVAAIEKLPSAEDIADAVLAKTGKPSGDGADKPKGDEGDESKEGSTTPEAKGDAADELAAYRRRSELLATAYELHVDGADSMVGSALERAIATAQLGGTLRADASDEYVKAIVDVAVATYADGADEDPELDEPKGGKVPTAPLVPRRKRGDSMDNAHSSFTDRMRNYGKRGD